MLHLSESDYSHIVNEALRYAECRHGNVDTEVEIMRDDDALVLIGVKYDYDREYRDDGLGYTDVKTDIYNFEARVIGSFDGEGEDEDCDFNEMELERAYNDIVRSL